MGSCDEALCNSEADYEDSMSDCEADDDADCDDMTACYDEYVDCFVDLCPLGTDASDADEGMIFECSLDLFTCVDTVLGN
jgi:hypothetical protein